MMDKLCVVHGLYSGEECNVCRLLYTGNTSELRDRIAIEAMKIGLQASVGGAYDGYLGRTQLAEGAYALADAMLSERAKKEGEK